MIRGEFGEVDERVAQLSPVVAPHAGIRYIMARTPHRGISMPDSKSPSNRHATRGFPKNRTRAAQDRRAKENKGRCAVFGTTKHPGKEKIMHGH